MYRLARRTAVLAVLAALALTVLAPPAAAGPATRPFTGTIIGGGMPVPDASCPLGVRTDAWGIGQVSHLGLTTWIGAHCQVPMGENITGGTQTLIAANGDRLETTYSITVDPFDFVEGAVLTGSGPQVINGGTGRFAGATGTFVAVFRGVLHFSAPMELTWWLDGEISY